MLMFVPAVAACSSGAVHTSEPASQPAVSTSSTAVSTAATNVRATAVDHSCTSAVLALSLARQVSAMNQPAAFFRLTNRSQRNCTVAGYPNLRLYDRNNRVAANRPRPGGAYLLNDPGPHTLTLRPGETAYFGFGWSAVNQPGGDVRGCTYATRERVVIPGSDVSVATRANLSSPICGRTSSVTAIAPRNAFKIATP